MTDKQIISLFNDTFYQAYNTKLVSGGEEPEYIPANSDVNYHRIIFTKDYIASALHEVAHWCIAGESRRQQLDYGYWYIPDGRNTQEQAEFERVESRSQSLEWIFSNALGRQFIISVDNLDCAQSRHHGPSLNFRQRIVEQARRYCDGALTTRARLWCEILRCDYDHQRDNLCQRSLYQQDLSQQKFYQQNNDQNSCREISKPLNYLDNCHYTLDNLR